MRNAPSAVVELRPAGPDMPGVHGPARLLVVLALVIPALGLTVMGALALVDDLEAFERRWVFVLLALGGLPLPALAALATTRDRRTFRIWTLGGALATACFGFCTFALGVGFVYPPSVVLLLLACAATYAPARIPTNAPAIVGGLAAFVFVAVGVVKVVEDSAERRADPHTISVEFVDEASEQRAFDSWAPTAAGDIRAHGASGYLDTVSRRVHRLKVTYDADLTDARKAELLQHLRYEPGVVSVHE
ncbi:hypothetical protein [Embleya hyalina]|uniref:hypothetical protein n=1 Tax=Embleya hyalina TaxID=516124 RepID=UPI000F8411E3|nr:hypothetical protein [Embleya hyalina]